MSTKEIDRIKSELNMFQDMIEEQEQLYQEMCLRSMIMSCLIYGKNIFTSVCINACSKYYHRPYAEKYIDILGYDRVKEIYNDQKKYFDTKCIVHKNVYTDCEGVTYNSLVEEE